MWCHIVFSLTTTFALAVGPEVFISYNWDHQETVKLLCGKLREAGFRCWQDIEQMGGGDAMNALIDNGIRTAEVTRFSIFKHSCCRV